MLTLIETRLTRPGQLQKPRLNEGDVDIIADFDEIGHDSLSTSAWKRLCHTWQLSPNLHIAVVEAGGTFCAPRMAWMLLQSGFKHVELITPHVLPPRSSVTRQYNETVLAPVKVAGFASQQEVMAAIQSNQQIVDVRSQARYTGVEADPRPQVRAGHIPTSINIHYGEFISPTRDKVFLPDDQLREVFSRHHIDINAPIIFSCGSGITACIGALAAVRCGAEQVSVYDGSWAEWGADHSLPMNTGEQP